MKNWLSSELPVARVQLFEGIQESERTLENESKRKTVGFACHYQVVQPVIVGLDPVISERRFPCRRTGMTDGRNAEEW